MQSKCEAKAAADLGGSGDVCEGVKYQEQGRIFVEGLMANASCWLPAKVRANILPTRTREER
eukprot:762969-Hanusia_phi.AAC.4